jgi:hypothetical protein
LFWVPILLIKGLKGESSEGFPYGLKYLDQKSALLVVAEKLNMFRIYKLSRPPLQ